MKTKNLITVLLALLVCTAGALAQGNDSSDKWLTVEVRSESGEPLRDACVTFVPKEGEIVFRKADSKGRVRLKRPAASNYRVVVKVDGYEAQKKQVAVSSSRETVAFTMQPRAN